MTARPSAGILLFRWTSAGLEVLLGHPGGPYWEKKDDDAWGIPKGEFEPHEGNDAYAVARREFREETGHHAPDVAASDAISLDTITKRSGKLVTAWALEGDLDITTAASNTFPLQWPPRSGRFIDVPEFDRLGWFAAEPARRKMRSAEQPFLERLIAILQASAVATGADSAEAAGAAPGQTATGSPTQAPTKAARPA